MTSQGTTRDLVLIALFVALIAVMAQIAIPLPLFVPFTMQTFAIFLAGIVLGARKAAIAAGLYLLLGALGVPVFSAASGGFGMLMGPSGGFLLSFPLVAFIVGLASKKANTTQGKQKYLWLISGLLTGMVVLFTAGMLQLASVNQISLRAAFVGVVLPFIVPDLLKAALALAIAPQIQRVLKDSIR